MPTGPDLSCSISRRSGLPLEPSKYCAVRRPSHVRRSCHHHCPLSPPLSIQFRLDRTQVLAGAVRAVPAVAPRPVLTEHPQSRRPARRYATENTDHDDRVIDSRRGIPCRAYAFVTRTLGSGHSRTVPRRRRGRTGTAVEPDADRTAERGRFRITSAEHGRARPCSALVQFVLAGTMCPSFRRRDRLAARRSSASRSVRRIRSRVNSSIMRFILSTLGNGPTVSGRTDMFADNGFA